VIWQQKSFNCRDFTSKSLQITEAQAEVVYNIEYYSASFSLRKWGVMKIKETDIGQILTTCCQEFALAN
jgi:hypothetical protein